MPGALSAGFNFSSLTQREMVCTLTPRRLAASRVVSNVSLLMWVTLHI